MMTSEEKQALKEAFKTCFIQAASIVQQYGERYPEQSERHDLIEEEYAPALDIIRSENQGPFERELTSLVESFEATFEEQSRYAMFLLDGMRGNDPENGFQMALATLHQFQSHLKPN